MKEDHLESYKGLVGSLFPCVEEKSYGGQVKADNLYWLQLNTHKVINFIATENAGSTKSGIPYLYKYLDLFTNFVI